MLIAFTDEITQSKDVIQGEKALQQNIEEYHYLKKVICFVSHKRGKNVGIIQIRIECFKQDRGASWSLIR